MIAKAICKVAAFEAPSTVHFSENMAISHLDLSDAGKNILFIYSRKFQLQMLTTNIAGLGVEHVPALNQLLTCVFPLRSVAMANNPLVGKKALIELSEAFR